MATVLDEIMAHTLLSVLARKQSTPAALLEQRASGHTPQGFAAALRTAAAKGPAVIAELKKASPSKGLLREDFRPVVIARAFAGVGAAALSVLTDEEFFKGSLADLEAVSAAVTIPVLRKDFILDEYQVLEARAAGADAVLLIVAAHTDETLRSLVKAARELHLDVLCEVHDRDELLRAIDLGVEVIGVNSRNLKTLEVSAQVHGDLVQHMPSAVLRVAGEWDSRAGGCGAAAWPRV